MVIDEQRTVADVTCPRRRSRAACYYTAGLLDVIGAADGSVAWGRLDAAVVNVYVAERGRGYGVASRAHIVDAIRCLLR